MPRRWIALLLCWLACAGVASAAERPNEEAADPAARPKIGLVLSGGGARGLAHVGVLKVLEREGVVVDMIAGTSMGAIIGGLYASGISASELESELLKVDWDALFASRVERRELSQRRKEEDFEIATDMESGARVVLASGDLALALRSSMSIPGVFAPTEVDGRILGDGGLVDNLPIEAVRRMGADVVIGVNIGTPLAGREALSSVTGLTSQMINILTEQNVQRSLATLRDGDLLIRPDLGELTSADFARMRDLIARGEQGALPHAARLAALGVGAARHAEWRLAMPGRRAGPARVAFVRFAGTELTNPARFAQQLQTRPGEPFDTRKAEQDVRRLAATGDYLRADYQIVSGPDGDGVVFELDDKPWGPNYLRLGVDLSTDFRGASAFNLKLSHNRHWLDANGSEWRNRLQIGEQPRWFTEWYHPLNLTSGLANDWFVSVYGDVSRRDLVDYDNDSGAELGRFNRKSTRIGIDLGQPWGAIGEVRFGLVHGASRSRAELVASGAPALPELVSEREYGLRLGLVVDQLDFANFPQHGYRLAGEGIAGFRSVSGGVTRDRINRMELSLQGVASAGRHTLNAYALLQQAAGDTRGALGRYTLGGFQLLSGYHPGQLDGNAVAFARLVYYQRRAEVPLLTRGLFIGASLEAGNVWPTLRAASASDLRTGASMFLGAETGVGPAFLGITYAPRGQPGIVLFIGRP